MEFVDTKTASSAVKMKLRKFGYKSALTVTDNYVAKKFGPQMPLMVAECLSQSLNVRENSTVKFDDNSGWSWLVSGRRLFAWPLAESGNFPDETATIVGKDLMLPASDLAYNADLIVIFRSGDGEFPSCLAVSPEGIVRFWYTLRAHRDWIDVNCQLGGEEVCTVVYLPPLGCLAVTTSASLVLIKPTWDDGSSSVSIRRITDKHTWFGGIGKRVSTFLGYVPPPQFLESNAIKVVATNNGGSSEWSVMLLAEHTLHIWTMETDRFEMVGEYNLEPVMKETLSENEESSWEVHDMQICEDNGIMILAGCRSAKLLVTLRFSVDELQPKLKSKYTLPRRDSDALVASTPQAQVKFLPTQRHTYLYTNQVVLAMPYGSAVDFAGYPGETVSFNNAYFLGAGFYTGLPIFFSTNHSYVSISPISPLEYVESSSSFPPPEPIQMMDEAEGNSPVAIITDAFKQHVKKNITKARTLVASFVSNHVNDSVLATSLVSVSLDIINQKSSNDPRTPHSSTSDFGITSLHVEKHLEQKERAHGLFVLFIDEIVPKGIGQVTSPHGLVSLDSVLADHHERIVAMRVLYRLKSQYGSIISKTLQYFAKQNYSNILQSISEDYLFTHSEHIYKFLECLCGIPDYMNRDGTNYEVYIRSVSEVNNILTEVLRTTVQTSENKKFLNDSRKFIPAICLGKPDGLLDSLLDQHKRTRIIGKDYGIALQHDKQYLEQLFSLTDIILYTQRHYAERFNELSGSLIEPFLDGKLYEQALMLGDKYAHYPSIVKSCLASGDATRLDRYLNKYGDHGFCEDLFKFYIDGKMSSALVDLELPVKHQVKLEKLLKVYPSIAWAYLVKRGNYDQAYKTLAHLGTRPNDFAVRQSRILSLAKLARECSDGKYDVPDVVDQQLEILSYQEILPDALVSAAGYPPDKEAPAFTPAELIRLFVSPMNHSADYLSYKAALELLTHIEDNEEKEELWSHIWERAVLTCVDMMLQSSEQPEAVVNECLLFRLIETIISSDDTATANSLIPSYNMIVELPGLAEYVKNPSFLYVLRYGYETYCDNQEGQDHDMVSEGTME